MNDINEDSVQVSDTTFTTVDSKMLAQVIAIKDQYNAFWREGDIDLKNTILLTCLSLIDSSHFSKKKLATTLLNELRPDPETDRQEDWDPPRDKRNIDTLATSILDQVWSYRHQGDKKRLISAKPFRISALMNHADHWIDQHNVLAWVNHNYPVKYKPSNEEDAALWVFYHVVNEGYGMDVAISIITRLQHGDLNQNQYTLFRTPIHYEEMHPYFHESILTPKIKDIFQRVKKINISRGWVKGYGKDKQFALMQSVGDHNTHTKEAYRERFEEIKKRLTLHHRQKVSEQNKGKNKGKIKTNSTETNVRLLSNKVKYFRLAFFSERLRESQLTHLEPAIYEQLKHLPLPTECEGGIARFWRSWFSNTSVYSTHPHQLSHHTEGVSLPLTHFVGMEVDKEQTDLPLDDQWIPHAKILVNEFTQWLRTRYPNGRKLTSAQTSDFAIELQTFIEKACQIAPATSALVMGFFWIGSKLLGIRPDGTACGKVNIQTAREYLNIIIRHGLLDIEEAYDLSDWDEELLNESMPHLFRRIRKPKDDSKTSSNHPKAGRKPSKQKRRSGLKDNTLVKRQKILCSFIRYAQYHGCFDDIQLDITNNYVLVKKRNRILSLFEFDQLLKRIDESSDSSRDMISIICILGFYGGLRAGEMRLLTLNDIEINRHEIWIHIKRGKSAAARRKIPLHYLVPPHIEERFRRYHANRVRIGLAYESTGKKHPNEFLKKPHHIAFLGLPSSHLGLTSKDLNQVIPVLRFHTQSGIDIHSLRHGFGTLLLLRAQVLKHPEMLENLREFEHAVFTKESQARFVRLFQYGSETHLKLGNIDVFVHCRKLMGHSHIKVTFDNYAHCFGVILAMTKMSDKPSTYSAVKDGTGRR